MVEVKADPFIRRSFRSRMLPLQAQNYRGGIHTEIAVQYRARSCSLTDLLEERRVSIQREFLNLPPATLNLSSGDAKISQGIKLRIDKTHSAERETVLSEERKTTVPKRFSQTVSECRLSDNGRDNNTPVLQTRPGT